MIFADSSGFIAAFDARDPNHGLASSAWRRVANEKQAMLTSDLVFNETVTHLRRRGGWQVSQRVGDALLRSAAIEIVLPERELFAAGWREFLRSADPKLSLCDAISFVIMRERGLDRVLSFDQHFRDAGFQILPWT